MSLIGKIGKGLKKAVKSGVSVYQDWEAKAPERQKKEMQRLQEQEKKLSMRAAIQKKKEKIRKLQGQSMPSNPFMSSGSGSMFGNPFQDQPVRRSSGSKKKKSGSRQAKRRVTEYF